MSNNWSSLPPVLPAGKLPPELLHFLLGRNTIADGQVVVGPGMGRDAAVIELGDHYLVLKTDPITFAVDDAPHYLVNVNANDLACLGATPRWLLVTALLPDGATTPSLATSIFDGLVSASRERGIELIGGHTEVTTGLDRPILVGMMLGLASAERLVEPGKARPGDRLLLTGPIAVEGTALIARELRNELTGVFDVEFLDRCANLLHEPGISVVPAATALLDSGGISALHDPTEGGLASGIREIAVASNCGALVDRSLIPVLPETEQLCRHLGLNPLGLLASGSLLSAVMPGRLQAVQAHLEDEGLESVVIGKLTPPDRDFTLIDHGVPGELPAFAIDEVARLFASRADNVGEN